MKLKSFTTLITFITLATSGCAKTEDSKTDEDGDTAKTETVGSLNISTNKTIPSNLAITSVTTQQSGVALKAGTIATGLTDESEGKDYYSKVEKIKKVLTTKTLSECAGLIPDEISIAQGNIGHAPCFGPQVDYGNVPNLDPDNGSFGNGGLGMFWDYADLGSTGDACSTVVVNNLMDNVASYADTANGLQALVACAGRLGEADISEVGKIVDMTEYLSDFDFSGKNYSITNANMTLISKSDKNLEEFKTEIKGKIKDIPRDIEKEVHIIANHSPSDINNETYTGTISYIIKDYENGNDLMLSIKYSYADSILKYRYRQTQVTADSKDLTSAVEVSANDKSSGWAEVVANVDASGLGKLVYVWNTFDNLVFNVETKPSGEGVAYFGHSSSENEIGTEDYYKIKGLRCFAQNGPGGDYTDYIQKQTLALNTTSGLWELKTSNIKFAPLPSCSWDENSDPNEEATFTVHKETQQGKVEENLTYPYVHELSDITSYKTDWSSPDLP